MDLKGQTALVVGASRGFGRGVVESLVARGMTVTAVARTRKDLEDLARKTSAKIIVADATNEQATEQILSETKPNLLVLSAGTTLDLRPLHEHTWETFSRAWEVDTKLTFLWVRAVLRADQGPQHVNSIWQWRSTFWFPAQWWLRRRKDDERLHCAVCCRHRISREALNQVPLFDSSDESAH
jgi:NAD(P)-dependent dehydrogenase (short-subunit alcohol dehydrogenase family)